MTAVHVEKWAMHHAPLTLQRNTFPAHVLLQCSYYSPMLAAIVVPSMEDVLRRSGTSLACRPQADQTSNQTQGFLRDLSLRKRETQTVVM